VGFWMGVAGQGNVIRMRKWTEKLGFDFHWGLSTLEAGREGLALLHVSSTVRKAAPVNGEFASRMPAYAG
jgi:hypothetical protein